MDENERHDILAEERREGYRRVAEETMELVEALKEAGFDHDEALMLAQGYVSVRFVETPTQKMLQALLDEQAKGNT